MTRQGVRGARCDPAGILPCMPRQPSGSPVGEALAWASRIIAIGVAMFLPGVAGGWLDARLGTRWIGPLGFVVGFAAALSWLASLGRGRSSR